MSFFLVSVANLLSWFHNLQNLDASELPSEEAGVFTTGNPSQNCTSNLPSSESGAVSPSFFSSSSSGIPTIASSSSKDDSEVAGISVIQRIPVSVTRPGYTGTTI